jgi:hypothetical protein
MLVRVLLASCVCFGVTTAAWPQATESLSGKVGAVEVKGKTVKLTVRMEVGDQTYDLPPKVELEVVSAGDDACLAPGLVVKVDAIESNKVFFATALSVYPDFTGKAPPATPVKAPKEVGQSQNRHFITGEIVQYKSQPEEKYDMIELKTTAKNVMSIYVERQHAVRVVQEDPSLITADQAVTVTGRRAGIKLIPAKVVIETGARLKGEEFVPTIKRKK